MNKSKQNLLTEEELKERLLESIRKEKQRELEEKDMAWYVFENLLKFLRQIAEHRRKCPVCHKRVQ